ncbi:hypothetical protein PHMEG_00040214 [Phytophthora megakarya]|uniref:Uncharacterized protein n=1 Tax=Phytophthora megakarya TaxID=4795 RepID=A0A225UDZ5_9STRA|nr:hypothetical protein PHMEG_00040214 [Phytophthora megakarya]
MTKTNKAFVYITNRAREDRKVARVLSGWGADEMPVVLDVATLDYSSQERLRQLQALLFSSCTGHKQQTLNVSTKVLNVLMAYLIRYYPQLKELASASPIITRWSRSRSVVALPVALINIAAPPVEEIEQTRDRSNHVCPRMDHLLVVIHELIETNRKLAARLIIVEAAQMKSNKYQAYPEAK